ncbi:MAG: DUF4129 domain-containing protein [Theionarchaea archaeon]|nr:DUF4129 domain-containing protein [Theionarchaea archaeon]
MNEIPDPEQIEEDLQEILRNLGYGSSPPDGGGFFPVELLVALMVVILLIILFSVAYFVLNRSLLSVKEPALLRTREEEELIERKDYFRFYKKAVDLGKKGDYVKAIRMLYLALLILLDSKEIIAYHPSLTNFEYRLRVHSLPFSNLFERVTVTFDTIYYGGKPATGSDFSSFMEAFTQIEEALP